MAKIKKKKNLNKCWWWYRVTELLLIAAAASAKSLQSCPTLCDPIDSSPPGSPIPASGMQNSIAPSEDSLAVSYKAKQS